MNIRIRLQPNQQRLFNWLRRTHPQLYKKFWAWKKNDLLRRPRKKNDLLRRPRLNSLGALQPGDPGFIGPVQPSGVGPAQPTTPSFADNLFDDLSSLATKYYQFQIQKDTLEQQIARAKADRELIQTLNTPPIVVPGTQNGSLIDPSTAILAIGGLLGLFALTRM